MNKLFLLFLALALFGCLQAQPQPTVTPVATQVVTPSPTPVPTPVLTASPTPLVTPSPTPFVPTIESVKSDVEKAINDFFQDTFPDEESFAFTELSYEVGGSVKQTRTYYQEGKTYGVTAPNSQSAQISYEFELVEVYPGETFDKGYSSVSTATVEGRGMTYEEGITTTKSSITCFDGKFGVRFELSNRAKRWNSDIQDWMAIHVKDVFNALSDACPK
ncbi:MAG: hypothetical protein ACE5DI_01925 [Candidatus Micrarchaeia archaeon]